MLDCEPLHDLKGHIQNLIDEVPSKLNKQLEMEVKQLIATDLSKDMKTGRDYRLTAVHLLTLLQKRDTPPKVLQLLESLVEISSILYAEESKRSPKLILRFYNTTWIHFELCCELFHTTNTISHQKMFGIYLHALLIHAPIQYEIMNLKSANTEHEERLFGQAKNMVQNTTNRQPATVIPNVLLRLQARQKKGMLHKEYHQSCNRISKEIQEMRGEPKNTVVELDYISNRMQSWEAHLQRISPYLTKGEGVWWQKTHTGYMFMDGHGEADVRGDGPFLRHFRDTDLQDIHIEKEKAWSQIINDSIELPTLYIRLFDANGTYLGRREFIKEGEMANDWKCVEQKERVNGKQSKTDKCVIVETEREDSEQSEWEVGEADDQEQSDREDREKLEVAGEGNREGDLSDKEKSESVMTKEETEADMNCRVEILNEEIEIPHNRTLTTKLCRAISHALSIETSDELIELDRLRQELKDCGHSIVSSAKDRYRKLLSTFKRRLLVQCNTHRADIKKFENKYYTTHYKLPSEDISEYNKMLQAERYTKKLLSSRDFL